MLRSCRLSLLAWLVVCANGVDHLAVNDRNELLYRLNNYAWVLATDVAAADGPAALEVAGWMTGLGDLPTYMVDTVSACYARGGHFEEAQQWQEEALRQAQRGGGADQTQAEFSARLTLYRAHQPYTEPGNPPPAQPFKMRWPDGTVKAEGPLAKDGNYTGFWRYFFQNGKPMAEGVHHDGTQFGRWRHWREDGSKSDEGHYFQGCRIGPWQEWHANGQLLGEGWYLERSAGDTTRCGQWTFFYDSGQKACTGAYANGQREGEWTFWNAAGEVATSATYHYDALHLLRHSQPGEIPEPYKADANQGANDF